MSDLSDWRWVRPVEIRITEWHVDITVRKRCKWLAVAWTSACLSMLSWVVYGDQYNATNGVWTSNTGDYQSAVTSGYLATLEEGATSFSDFASLQTSGTSSAVGSFTINYVWSGPSQPPLTSCWLVTSTGSLSGVGSATPTLKTGYGSGRASSSSNPEPQFSCPISVTTIVSAGGASPSFTDAYSASLSGGFGTGSFTHYFSVAATSLSVGPGSGTAGGGTTTGGDTTGGTTSGGNDPGDPGGGSTTSGDPGNPPPPPPPPPTTAGGTSGSTAGAGTGGDTSGTTTGGTAGSTAGGGSGSGGLSVTGSGLTLVNGQWEAMVGAPVCIGETGFDTNSSGAPIGTWTITGSGVCTAYVINVGPTRLTSAQTTNQASVILADYLPETVTATFQGTYQGIPASVPFTFTFKMPTLTDPGLINDSFDQEGQETLGVFPTSPVSTLPAVGAGIVWSWDDPYIGQTGQMPLELNQIPGLSMPSVTFEFGQLIESDAGSCVSNPPDPPDNPSYTWTYGLVSPLDETAPTPSLDAVFPAASHTDWTDISFHDFPGTVPPVNPGPMSSLDVSQTFQTSLIYTPSGGIPIPIEANSWGWSNDAAYSSLLSEWEPFGTFNPGVPTASSTYPTWSFVIIGTNAGWY